MFNVTFSPSNFFFSIFFFKVLIFFKTIELNPILDELVKICQDYFERMYQCESQKYDMEFECRKKDLEVEKGLNLHHSQVWHPLLDYIIEWEYQTFEKLNPLTIESYKLVV